jgi:AraC-like DNA-binding protein
MLPFVIGKLSVTLATHAAAALRTTHALRIVSTWDELESALAARSAGHSISAVLLEPSPQDETQDAHIARLIRWHPTLPLITYMPCTHACVRRALAWSQLGVHHVVLHGLQDTVFQLRAIIDASEVNETAMHVLDAIDTALHRLPEGLKHAVRQLFLRPHAIRTAPQLAHTAHLSRREMDRQIRQAALAPAHTLISAASLLWAYHLIHRHQTPIIRIAEQLGYQTTRMLNRQAEELLRLRPSRWRTELPEEELIRRVIAITWQPSASLEILSALSHAQSRDAGFRSSA